MLLSIVFPVLLDLRGPPRARVGVEDCHDDYGRSAAYGDFGQVWYNCAALAAAAASNLPQQPKDGQEAHYAEYDQSQPVSPQEVL